MIMTPEKQRITIAEFCGWAFECKAAHGYSVTTISKEGKGVVTGRSESEFGMMDIIKLPDYLNDLNAMHEAEKLLTDEQIWKYISKLVDLTGAESLEEYAEAFVMIHATAAQRAEALLRTIGKWEEN